VEFFHTHVGPDSVRRATDVLSSGWLSEGKIVKEFESTLAARLGLSQPVTVNSGTAALHLALAVFGIGPGDEVILPAQTFVATGLVILMCGASPVFADIDPSTGNLDPAAVRAKAGPRTRAILPVDWAGYPCDLDELHEVAHSVGAVVIEDAAHALGATYKDRPIGAVSDSTALSFQAIKHLTTGDGGAICFRDQELAERARTRRWFGIDRVRSRPSILGEREFDIAQIGYKYHLNDLAASVGLGNFVGLDDRLERRRSNGAFYRNELASVPGIGLLQCASDRTHAYWLFTLRAKRREDLIRKLSAAGIPSSVVHLRIDRYSVFGGMADLSGQAEFEEEQLSIPVHDALSDEELQHIVSTIKGGW